MKEQSYSSHGQMVPMFHYVLFGILLMTLIGSCVNLWRSIGDHQGLYSASLILALTVGVLILYVYCRVFALKAQDRAIRAEENLRHFALTGKLLDPRIGIRQVIALRFASDGEFVALAARAAGESLSSDDIKRAVKNWRADHYRV